LLSLDEIVKIVERSTNTLAEDVEGDGLCLIHAINKAREPLQPIPKEIARKLITDFYATTLIGQQSGITAERILRIQTDWLEDDAILALTHLLQCNIEVYNINTTRLKGSIDIALHQPEGSFNLPTVKILLLNDVHFQALKDNSTASPPPKASLPPSSAIPVVAQSPVLLSSEQHRSTTSEQQPSPRISSHSAPPLHSTRKRKQTQAPPRTPSSDQIPHPPLKPTPVQTISQSANPQPKKKKALHPNSDPPIPLTTNSKTNDRNTDKHYSNSPHCPQLKKQKLLSDYFSHPNNLNIASTTAIAEKSSLKLPHAAPNIISPTTNKRKTALALDRKSKKQRNTLQAQIT
jgi:hypothetical protein